jgi:hypothetical protein
MTAAGFENYNVRILSIPPSHFAWRPVADASEQDLLNDIRSRFTIKSLKALCQTASLPVGGNKPHLQQRLQLYLSGLRERQQTVPYQTMKTIAEVERGYAYAGGPNR